MDGQNAQVSQQANRKQRPKTQPLVAPPASKCADAPNAALTHINGEHSGVDVGVSGRVDVVLPGVSNAVRGEHARVQLIRVRWVGHVEHHKQT